MLLPLLSPQRLLRFSSRTKIDKSNSACCLFVQALPLSLSLSVYFFAQSSFSSGAGILFLRVARREWSDAFRFENNRGVGSRVAGASTKNNILTVRGKGRLRPLEREPLPFPRTIITNVVYLANALRVDKRNRSPLSSNLLEPFSPPIT